MGSRLHISTPHLTRDLLIINDEEMTREVQSERLNNKLNHTSTRGDKAESSHHHAHVAQEGFQREVFEGALMLIPGCALIYLGCQLVMGSPMIELVPTLGVMIGCLLTRWLARNKSARATHLIFIVVILGLFIPSWITGGGALRPTRAFSVIFFSLHIVLFPTARLRDLIALWMTFTLATLSLEYAHPEMITGRLTSINAPPSILIEQAVVHLIIFLSCGLLLRHTIKMFWRSESKLQEINRAQRDLLRITSHDLRGPVNNLQLGIEALVTVIERRVAQEGARHDPIENLIKQLAPTMKLQVQHMDFLMRNLSYFRLNHNEHLTPNLEMISARELITQVTQGWQIHAERHQLCLTLDVPEDTLQIITDRMFFKQIIDNLISNALKHSPPHAEVEVSVRQEDADVIISVADQGSGISPEDQSRIFELFERVGDPHRPREHSIGLGLWIVNLLTPLINAVIEVDSAPEQGSTFRLILRDCAA